MSGPQTTNMENTDTPPSWEEITPTLIELIHGDNDEAAKAAMLDLRRMAQLADQAVVMLKANQS
jgi:hypothetical protein